MVKFCRSCNQEKDINLFHKRGGLRDGIIRYRSICKQCHTARNSNRDKLKRSTARLEKQLSQPKINDGFKICADCKITKELSQFTKHKRYKDGLRRECKDCTKLYNSKPNRQAKIKEYRDKYYAVNKKEMYKKARIRISKNKEKTSLYHKLYYHNNVDKIKKLAKIYYESHKIKIRNAQKQYYTNNKDLILEKQRNYNILNRDKCTIKSYNWRNKNRAKYIFYRNKRKKERYQDDICFKLKNNIISRVNLALKNNYRSGRTEELLGCTIQELKIYLESKFQDGMSWDNRSEFHIDHIIPCSSFDLSDPEQQRICFHYTNLQPLWAKDNLKKGAKINMDPL